MLLAGGPMDREALAQPDREALIEIIPRQQALIEQLAARQGEPPKTLDNSSVPPSQSFNAVSAHVGRPAPGLDERNYAVCTEPLGLTDDEFVALHGLGIFP